MVSIKFTEFNFTGGAHPNSSVNFLILIRTLDPFCQRSN
ncbi:hypothetical protein [Algoriphagus halophilus]